jgi:hypothetical protein
MATKRTSRRTNRGERLDASVRVLMLSLADWFDDPSPMRGKVVAADLRTIEAMLRPPEEARGRGAPPSSFPDCCSFHVHGGSSASGCGNGPPGNACECKWCKKARPAESGDFPDCCPHHRNHSPADDCCNEKGATECFCDRCKAKRGDA